MAKWVNSVSGHANYWVWCKFWLITFLREVSMSHNYCSRLIAIDVDNEVFGGICIRGKNKVFLIAGPSHLGL